MDEVDRAVSKRVVNVSSHAMYDKGQQKFIILHYCYIEAVGTKHTAFPSYLLYQLGEHAQKAEPGEGITQTLLTVNKQ